MAAKRLRFGVDRMQKSYAESRANAHYTMSCLLILFRAGLMRAVLRSTILAACSCAALVLSGCSNNFDPSQGEKLETATVTMQGEVFGRLLSRYRRARVFLFSPGTTGVGGASTSLISAEHDRLRAVDSTSGSITNGARYVLTGLQGRVHLYVDLHVGGTMFIFMPRAASPRRAAANNPQIGLMSVVGECPGTGTVDATPYVRITENTTVAAAYALAGFCDPTRVTSALYRHRARPGGGLAMHSVRRTICLTNWSRVNSASSVNGFTTATTTPGSTGTIPQTLLNTLSNILVACVNSGQQRFCDDYRLQQPAGGMPPSDGERSARGPTAPATGSFSADAPADTATAMINIAHHPFANLTSLFNLQGTGAGQVYKPALGPPRPPASWWR